MNSSVFSIEFQLIYSAHPQASVCEVYPARISLNAMICFFASLQSSVVALIFDRKPSSWKLEWNVQLLTITYCVSCLYGSFRFS